MSSIAFLKEVAELANLTIDKDLIRRNIKKYIKTPKMISVKELFRINNLSYEDRSDCIRVSTQYGDFDLPKDGFSDAYRLSEATVMKTRGGKNMIVLPNIDGIMVDHTSAEKWNFKEQWDLKVSTTSTQIWGGVFQTAAIDYDNDDDYTTLDLTKIPHYYNVLLTPREKREFSVVNSGMTYVACENGCMSKKHYHGVHGLYQGASIDFAGGVAHCAPPMDLIEIWRKIEPLNPENAALVETATQAAVTTLAPLLEKPEVSANTEKLDALEYTGAGANYLKKLLEDLPSWTVIVERYSRPDTAVWSSSDRFASTTSAKKKMKQRWTSIYGEHIIPLLAGEGTPTREVLQAAWDLDPTSDKTVANYCVRRLTAGDSTVVATKNGYLKFQ